MSTGTITKPESNGAIAKTDTTIKGWLQSDSLKAEVAKVLPKHMKPERMMRIAISALTRVPKLNECTPASFVRCLLDLSAWGLEPNGRDAHLIPYGKECTLILDYKGIVTLAYRSGVVKKIHADVVRTGDLFKYNMGEVQQHEPWAYRTDTDKPAEAGEIIAAYCVVQMADGVTKCEVMSKNEVESIRRRSKAGNSGPWQTDWSEMAKKTAFRRASKWLPLSSEINEAFERDDDRLHGVVTAEPGSATNRTAALESKLGDMLNAESTEQETVPVSQ